MSWFTVGVSPNIIEASFKALIDSLDYKLFKEKAPGNLNEKFDLKEDHFFDFFYINFY